MSDAHPMPDEAPAAELGQWITLLERDLNYLEERAKAEARMWANAIREKRMRLAQIWAVYEIKRRGEALMAEEKRK